MYATRLEIELLSTNDTRIGCDPPPPAMRFLLVGRFRRFCVDLEEKGGGATQDGGSGDSEGQAAWLAGVGWCGEGTDRERRKREGMKMMMKTRMGRGRRAGGLAVGCWCAVLAVLAMATVPAARADLIAVKEVVAPEEGLRANLARAFEEFETELESAARQMESGELRRRDGCDIDVC